MKKILAMLLCILSACATNNEIKREYYENGNIKEEILYIEDKEVWNKLYYETGELFTYRDDNIGRMYYTSGQISDEIPLKDGKKHGIVKLYKPNGKLQKEIYYEKGVKDWQKEYDENGNLIKDKKYYDTGDIWIEGFSENGKLVSGNFYVPKGQLVSTTFFDENKKKTKMIMYDKDGTPLSETGYKDGEEIYKKKYDENGNLIKE
ncbi:hypothetical protein HDR60_01810 [bacterium]|nr:hypothetical protein [bacterium]